MVLSMSALEGCVHPVWLRGSGDLSSCLLSFSFPCLVYVFPSRFNFFFNVFHEVSLASVFPIGLGPVLWSLVIFGVCVLRGSKAWKCRIRTSRLTVCFTLFILSMLVELWISQRPLWSDPYGWGKAVMTRRIASTCACMYPVRSSCRACWFRGNWGAGAFMA